MPNILLSKIAARLGGMAVAFIAFANPCLAQSKWEWIDSPPEYRYPYQSIQFINHQFVAQGNNILASPDGTAWSLKSWKDIFKPDDFLCFYNRCLFVGDNGSVIFTAPANNSGAVFDSIRSSSGVFYQNGIFVTVKSNYQNFSGAGIYTSKDDSTWTRSTSIPDSILIKTLSHGNNRFVALASSYSGFNYYICTSSDGVSWAYAPSPSNIRLYYLYFVHNIFIAISVYDTIYTSPDGAAWSKSSVTGTTNYYPKVPCVYGNGQFVFLGNRTIFSSPDGNNWNYLGTTNYPFWKATFGDSLFAAVDDTGNIFTSSDLTHWTKRTMHPTRIFTSVACGNNMFMILSDDGKLFYSQDGAHVHEAFGESADYFYSISFVKDRFFAVSSERVYTSTDGITWTIHFSVPDHYTLNSISYGKNLFVGVGIGPGLSGSTSHSDNGNSWEFLGQIDPLNAVTFGNNLFVAVGYRRAGVIYNSSDGVSWSKVEWEDPDRQDAYPYYPKSVAYGNNRFIAVGEMVSGGPVMPAGAVFSSIDGKTWSVTPTMDSLRNPKSMYQRALSSITFGNNQFVAVSDFGAIFSSRDGITWSQKPSGTDYHLSSIAYGNNRFVAVGGCNTVLVSAADTAAAVSQTSHAGRGPGNFKLFVTNKSIQAVITGNAAARPYSLALFDISGRRIYSMSGLPGDGKFEVPVQGIPSGTYFLKITDSRNNGISSKITVAR